MSKAWPSSRYAASCQELRTSDFDYFVPSELIAQEPLAHRDASRLMVLPKKGQNRLFEHRSFTDLPRLLNAGDLLVVNDARVVPVRIRCRKEGSGGKVEVLLVTPLEDRGWRVMVGSSKPVRPGTRLLFDGCAPHRRSQRPEDSHVALVEEVEGEGFARLSFDLNHDDLFSVLEAGAGEVPLPPYIDRRPGHPAKVDDRERYQTVFAGKPGAAAAPTAGLHFTERILEALKADEIEVARLTLMVGPGTFLPVRTENINEHAMHGEAFHVPEVTTSAIDRTRASGGRIVAVGTTVLRTLEAAGDESGRVSHGDGWTDLFIRPGYRFRVVDGLLTNFHLPRSTLLMLVCAIGGRHRVLDAYRQAVEKRYRFFSYGDAMLII